MTLEYKHRLAKAVQHFWKVRSQQHQNQGSATGRRDAGNRSAVTGGKHHDGFIKLLAELLSEAGLPDTGIHPLPQRFQDIFGRRSIGIWSLS